MNDNENEDKEPYLKPELTKLENLKEITTYDCQCSFGGVSF